jgi:hypothetical protein
LRRELVKLSLKAAADMESSGENAPAVFEKLSKDAAAEGPFFMEGIFIKQGRHQSGDDLKIIFPGCRIFQGEKSGGKESAQAQIMFEGFDQAIVKTEVEAGQVFSFFVGITQVNDNEHGFKKYPVIFHIEEEICLWVRGNIRKTGSQAQIFIVLVVSSLCLKRKKKGKNEAKGEERKKNLFHN